MGTQADAPSKVIKQMIQVNDEILFFNDWCAPVSSAIINTLHHSNQKSNLTRRIITGMTQSFPVYQCTHPECRLRFPGRAGHGSLERCPKCGNPAKLVEDPQVDLQVRPHQAPPGAPIVDAFLDNIRSTFNVGAMLRTADGAGLRRVYLAGITPLPTHPRVAKTALGAEQAVDWQHHPDGAQAAAQLKEDGMCLWAIEGGPVAESLFSVDPTRAAGPIVLVVGNEITGIDPAVLSICEKRLTIPMLGFKRSFNVAIAFGVAVYHLRFGRALRS